MRTSEQREIDERADAVTDVARGQKIIIRLLLVIVYGLFKVDHPTTNAAIKDAEDYLK